MLCCHCELSIWTVIAAVVLLLPGEKMSMNARVRPCIGSDDRVILCACGTPVFTGRVDIFLHFFFLDSHPDRRSRLFHIHLKHLRILGAIQASRHTDQAICTRLVISETSVLYAI